MKYTSVLAAAAVLLSCASQGACWPIDDDLSPSSYSLHARATPATGSSTANSTITLETRTLSRQVNTALAIWAFLQVAGTYSILVLATADTSSVISLPDKMVASGLRHVLNKSWSRDSAHAWRVAYKYEVPVDRLAPSRPSTLAPGREGLPLESDGSRQAWVLGYPTEYDGVTEKEESSNSTVTLMCFSPVAKSLVQLGIWTYASLWVTCIMIINTILYNGFATHNYNTEGVLRLVLVCGYAVAHLGSVTYTINLLATNFLMMNRQACMTIISNRFVFQCSETDGVSQTTTDSDRLWKEMSFDMFGRWECYKTYRPQECRAASESYPEAANNGDLADGDRIQLIEMKEVESKADKIIKPALDTELKSYEKAAEAALEKAIANFIVMLGICLATGLAPWTSSRTLDATGAQLGSYALLLAISTGALALVACVTHLTNATESAERYDSLLEDVLRFQEYYVDGERNRSLRHFPTWKKNIGQGRERREYEDVLEGGYQYIFESIAICARFIFAWRILDLIHLRISKRLQWRQTSVLTIDTGLQKVSIKVDADHLGEVVGTFSHGPLSRVPGSRTEEQDTEEPRLAPNHDA